MLVSAVQRSKSASAAAAKSLQSCPTLHDPIDGSPPRLSRPWDSPGKNTGVGCHFLLQCMKVKSESEVAQLCPTQRPHGMRPTRFLRPRDFPGKGTGVGHHCLLRWISYMCINIPSLLDPSPTHPSRSRQSAELSLLHYSAGSHQLPVCTAHRSSPTPQLVSLSLPDSHIRSLGLHRYSCPANRLGDPSCAP